MSAPPAPNSASSQRFLWSIAATFTLAIAWRLTLLLTMPTIARDGVTFSWYARDLAQHGLAYLQSDQADQHPLFPTLILTLHHAIAAPDTPLAWQYSGQAIALAAGLTVIALVGLLTNRLIHLLDLPVNQRTTTLCAMLLTTLLPLNLWLSVDVMSDQLHLAFYLGAVLLLLRLASARAAALCGLLGGLAFLTREEGIVILAAGLVTLAAQWKRVPTPRLLARAAALLAGFLICAAPYWAIVGGFSNKKDPADLLRDAPANATATRSEPSPNTPSTPTLTHAGFTTATLLAKLERHDLPWYLLLPHAIYKLLRAGRVVIPLLALLPLLNLRSRWTRPPLVGPLACFTLHFLLTLLLLSHFGYLSPRHLLVPVTLLIPFAALLLARLVQFALERRGRLLATIVLLVFLLPLAAYGLRVPNRQDAFLRDAARWLINHDPDRSAKRLISGSSARRIAFYADIPWEPWYEKPDEHRVLERQILNGPPGYLALELGPQNDGVGFERAGNRQLLHDLLNHPQVGPRLQPLQTIPGPGGIELHLLTIK